MLCSFCHKAGKKTTDEELEEMLESGNPTIFTSGVSGGGTVHREGQGELHCSCGYAEEGAYVGWGVRVVQGQSVTSVADGLSVWGLL